MFIVFSICMFRGWCIGHGSDVGRIPGSLELTISLHSVWGLLKEKCSTWTRCGLESENIYEIFFYWIKIINMEDNGPKNGEKNQILYWE